jgi:hypothetical protein
MRPACAAGVTLLPRCLQSGGLTGFIGGFGFYCSFLPLLLPCCLQVGQATITVKPSIERVLAPDEQRPLLQSEDLLPHVRQPNSSQLAAQGPPVLHQTGQMGPGASASSSSVHVSDSAPFLLASYQFPSPAIIRPVVSGALPVAGDLLLDDPPSSPHPKAS